MSGRMTPLAVGFGFVFAACGGGVSTESTQPEMTASAPSVPIAVTTSTQTTTATKPRTTTTPAEPDAASTTTSTTAVPDDPLYDPDRWIGESVEGRPPDYGIVYLNGAPTGLRRWGGGCVGSDCGHYFNLVYSENAEGLVGGYPMMIWLVRLVQSSTETPDAAEVFEVIDARFVQVPPGYGSGFECTIEDQAPDEWVVALVHQDKPLRAVWAWTVGVSTGITAIAAEQVTCSGCC